MPSQPRGIFAPRPSTPVTAPTLIRYDRAMALPDLPTLPALPFADQLTAIHSYIKHNTHLPELLDTLAAQPDHEPLARALLALAQAERLGAPEITAHLTRLLPKLPDTGIQRILNATAELPPPQLRHLVNAVATAIQTLDIDRIAALCLLDRWLKNTDPERRQALTTEALHATQQALQDNALHTLPEPLLVRIPGAHLEDLERIAAHRPELLHAWRKRCADFAHRVLARLQTLPRSLSQANAEHILSRRVYTDPGHFLVELLQNAEDAGAERCIIDIDEDTVRVWHNGAPFDARDVVGVLSIGQTTKAREQIGFFGVGFKSVYEICERPRIESGFFSFEIADVSIPRPLKPPPRPAYLPEGGTLLTLPYRDGLEQSRSPRALFGYAQAIPPETLLTLTHLRHLHVRHGDTFREVQREALTDAAALRLHISTPAGDTTRDYRVATQRFDYTGPREPHKARSTRVLVAAPSSPQGHPLPLDPGAPALFSHLPTRQSSGLRTLVHAHFDVPVDRERLDLESPWNRWALSCAGALAAQLISELPNTAHAHALDLVPLQDELHHPIFTAFTHALRHHTQHLAWLPGAHGAPLRANQGHLLQDPTFIPILAGVPLDPQGRLALAPNTPRDANVMRFLGATPLPDSALIEILEAHLQPPSPPAWAQRACTELVEALGHERYAPFDPRLQPLALLPDQDEKLRPAAEMVRMGPELRSLYGPVRPHLLARLDDTPSPRQESLLRRLGVARHTVEAVLDDLAIPERANALLHHAGALAIHHFLARFPADRVEIVANLPLFPDRAGVLHPLSGPNAVSIGTGGPLETCAIAWDLPLLHAEMVNALRPYLERIGAIPLRLDLLLDAVEHNNSPSSAALHALHTLLESHPLSSHHRTRLRSLPVFSIVDHPTPRPLTGPDRALLPADADIIERAPSLPWLTESMQKRPHVRALEPTLIDARELARAMLLESPWPELVDPFSPTSLEHTYAYLISHPPTLPLPLRDRLRTAPLWLDTLGEPHPLEALRQSPELQALDALYAAWLPHPTISPHALEAARALRLAPLPAVPSALELAADLSQHSALSTLLEGPLRAQLVEALCELAQTGGINAEARSALRALPLYRSTGGQALPLGRWSEPFQSPSVVRVPDALRAIFSELSSRPLLDPGDEAELAPVLNALNAPPAGLDELAQHLDAETEPRLLHQARALFSDSAEQLGSTSIRTRDTLAALPLWPARDGTMAAASERVHPRRLERVIGDDWEQMLDAESLASRVLAEDAVPHANALASVVTLGSPVALIAERVRQCARPDQPLNAQVSWLASPQKLARWVALMDDDHLPLGVNARRELVSGPLLVASEEEATLARDLPLEARLALPGWAEPLLERAPRRLSRLPARHLLDALLEESREACRVEEHPRLHDPEIRGALYLWLERQAEVLATDPTARGRLGSAHLFLTRAGRLVRADQLLMSGRHAALAEELGLLERCPHEALSETLLTQLNRLFDLSRRGLATWMEALVQGMREAASEGQGERTLALLKALHDTLESATDTPAEYGEQVQRFKLRKLKLETHTGDFDEARKLLHIAPLDATLLDRFLGASGPARLHPRYLEPVLEPLLSAMDTREELPLGVLREALANTTLTPDAAVARAAFIARAAAQKPALIHQLELAQRAWMSDGEETLRTPSELYWPTHEIHTLIGERPELFPHPEVVHTAPAEVRQRLPFADRDAIKLSDLLVHVHGEGLDTTALDWLEQSLRQGKLNPRACAVALGQAPVFPADDGTLRAPGELVCDPDGPLYFGRLWAVWSDGLRYSKLASTLKIAPRIGSAEVRRFLAQLATRLNTTPTLLDDHRELALGVPRCLAFLAREDAEPVVPLPLIATHITEGSLSLAASDAEDVALPLPSELAQAAREAGAPLRLAWVTEDAGGRVSAWMRRAGLRPLEALVTLELLPSRLPGDRSSTHQELLERKRERLGHVVLALAEIAPDAMVPVEHVTVALVEGLERRGQLLGTPVTYAAQLAVELKRGTVRVVWTPPALHDNAALAAALVDALCQPDAPRARLIASAVSLLNAPDLNQLAAAKKRALNPEPQPVVPEPKVEPPPETPPEDEPSDGLWRRFKRWWGSDGDKDVSPEEKSVETRPRERGRDWFQAREAIDAQLEDNTRWVEDRFHRPEFGLAFAPENLPLPWRYAPQSIASSFDRRAQRWRVLEHPGSWSSASPTERHVAFSGMLPRGQVMVPVPLYASLDRIEVSGAHRSLSTRDGKTLLSVKEDSSCQGQWRLEEAPRFLDTDHLEVPVDEALLQSTAADGELPSEVLDFVDAQRADAAPWRVQALAVRDFVREHYRYDPTYLEDAAVARWLKNVSRGRDNVHLAALHAGRDARHLGRGVCYELNVLVCELLRRLAIPAAIATGWTLDRGQLDAPDHLWAMALLPTREGPRWMPLDAASTREGRPLHAAQRPAGPWRVQPPERGEPIPEPDADEFAAPPPMRGSSRGQGRPSSRGSASRSSGRRSRRVLPVPELIRVLRYLERKTGEPLADDDLAKLARELLEQPETLRQKIIDDE